MALQNTFHGMSGSGAKLGGGGGDTPLKGESSGLAGRSLRGRLSGFGGENCHAG
jgi:hypothetical protein